MIHQIPPCLRLLEKLTKDFRRGVYAASCGASGIPGICSVFHISCWMTEWSDTVCHSSSDVCPEILKKLEPQSFPGHNYKPYVSINVMRDISVDFHNFHWKPLVWKKYIEQFSFAKYSPLQKYWNNGANFDMMMTLMTRPFNPKKNARQEIRISSFI